MEAHRASDLRAGWWVVARKELADHVRSTRFAILVAIISLAAVASVVAAAGRLRAVAPDVTGTASLFLRLFTIQLAGTPLSFASIMALVGPLLGIAFAFDAISSERSDRTLPRLISQPIHRDDVINGKFVAGILVITVVLVSLTLVVSGVGMIALGVVPSVSDAGRLAAWLLATVLYVSVWLALALLLSVRLTRAATAAMAGLGIWLVLTLFGGVLVNLAAGAISPVGPQSTAEQVIENQRTQQVLGRVMPSYLYEEVTAPLLAPQQRTLAVAVTQEQAHRAIPGQLPLTQSLLLAWPQAVVLVGLAVVLFAFAYVSFLRQEIRA